MSRQTTPPLDGHWELVRAELDGEQAPELIVTRTEMTLNAGTYTVLFAGEVADRGTFELGEGTAHLRGDVGVNAGRSIPCIYQRVGSRLRVCYGLNGTLPTDFATAAGQQRYLATYRLKSAVS
jgi:uncharacterized protein (TIGR03067 family)